VFSSIYQVSLKSVQWFCRCGWSKIAISHYFGHWLIQQLSLYYRTSRDSCSRKHYHSITSFSVAVGLLWEFHTLNVLCGVFSGYTSSPESICWFSVLSMQLVLSIQSGYSIRRRKNIYIVDNDNVDIILQGKRSAKGADNWAGDDNWLTHPIVMWQLIIYVVRKLITKHRCDDTLTIDTSQFYRQLCECRWKQILHQMAPTLQVSDSVIFAHLLT